MDGIGIRVHPLDVELGDDVDALLLQNVAQETSRPRLGERGRQRGGQGQLHTVTQALLVEEIVGQEEELQRRHRALDGHLGHVEHQPAAFPRAQKLVERHRAVHRIKIEDVLAPAVFGQARRLVRHDA